MIPAGHDPRDPFFGGRIVPVFGVGLVARPEAAFTSASTGKGFSGNVRFTIHGRHGKRIERLSAYPSEREVLFKAGTQFRVLNVRREENWLTRIEMEEIDDA